MLFKEMYKLMTSMQRYTRAIDLFDPKDKITVSRIVDLKEHLIPQNYIKKFLKELREQSVANDNVISGEFELASEIGEEELLGLKLFKSKSN
jgi:hypothetical protein